MVTVGEEIVVRVLAGVLVWGPVLAVVAAVPLVIALHRTVGRLMRQRARRPSAEVAAAACRGVSSRCRNGRRMRAGSRRGGREPEIPLNRMLLPLNHTLKYLDATLTERWRLIDPSLPNARLQRPTVRVLHEPASARLVAALCDAAVAGGWRDEPRPRDAPQPVQSPA